VNGAADFFTLEEGDASFGIRGDVAHGYPLYSVKLAASAVKDRQLAGRPAES
jgi:hypothetical protein